MDGIQPTYNMSENDGAFGGSGIWLFAILALFLFGGGGYGVNRNNTPTDYARQSDVVYTSAFNQLQGENANIISEIQRQGASNNSTTKDVAYNNLSELRDLQSVVSTGFANQQTCCCQTQRAIDSVNYNMATTSANIIANDTANTQKVLDAIAQNKVEQLQARINQLELAQATSSVVRYPTATTYTSGTNPFCSCNGSLI